MKSFFSLLTIICCQLAFTQSDTEVYLFDLKTEGSSYTLSNQRNISNNPGYDNQPYFYDNNVVIFASTRNNQTDIAAYSLKDKSLTFINDTNKVVNTPLLRFLDKRPFLLSDLIPQDYNACTDMPSILEKTNFWWTIWS